eukprot:6093928-Prorocentrum_lima.AAC.1
MTSSLVGSEMCIRDRLYIVRDPRSIVEVAPHAVVATHSDWQINEVVVKCDIARVDIGIADTHPKPAQ